MTDRHIGLVAVKHDEHHDRCFLFEAPCFCKFEVGELVLVDTQYGEKFGYVEAVHDWVKVGGDEYNFVVKAMGATEPLKRVIGTIKRYEYKDEGVK